MKRFWRLWAVAVCATLNAAEPVSVEQAVVETRRDVQESTRELIALREEIRGERIPLAQRVEELRARTAALRVKVKETRGARDLVGEERRRLDAEIGQLEREQEFVQTVFTEYRRSLETRLQAAEVAYLTDQLPEEDGALWDTSARLLDLRHGGYHFSGQALDAQGRVVEGEVVILGPQGYFLNREVAGILISRPGSRLPGIFPLRNAQTRESLTKVLAGESADLPVDVSGGDAMKVIQARPNWIEHLRQGGVVVIPLLLLGFCALLLALLKTIDLSGMRVALTPAQAEKLRRIRDEDAEAAVATFMKGPQPLGGLLVAAVHHRHASREHLEEILHEHVLGVVPRLERSLGTLAVLGAVAPLLGLLGTVTGMIHTFQLVKLFGSGNTTTLSGGISEALVTTELGLVIAIPILLAHAFLARRARVLLGELEHSGVRMVNLLQTDSPSAE